MLASEQDQLVRDAILRLPVEQREVVLLHFSEGLSQHEIASRLGVFQTTVGRRLRKALKAMKGTLEPVLFENVVRESMQRESAKQDSSQRKPTSPLKPSRTTISRVIALGGATAALSATAKAALIEQAGGAAWLALASAAATESLLATGKTAALLKTFTTALAAGGKIMTAGKGITAIVMLCALLAIGVYEYEKHPQVQEDKPADKADQASISKTGLTNTQAPKPAADSGLPAQKPNPGKATPPEYPDAKGQPLWGVTVPTPPWSKTSYHVIADGKTRTDSFNTREPSTPNEQWFETPITSNAKSPRKTDNEQLQFLYAGKLDRFAMFQSPCRGGVWGIDEFKPLNKEAEENWRAMAKSPELGRIAGIVVDMKHRPIPRARVLVMRNVRVYERTVECNDAGQFIVERLPPFALEFTARAFGFGLEKVTARIKPGAQSDALEIVLKSTTPIIGQVTNESGGLLPGAVIEAKLSNPATNYAPPESATDTAVTDKAGKYVLASLPLESYKLTADLAGYANEIRTAELLESTQPLQVDFVLREGKSVVGRVIRRHHGKDGPVAGVEVKADVDPQGKFIRRNNNSFSCLSNKEGTFRFDALPLGQPILLNATTREQFSIEARKTVLLTKDKTPDPVELRLVETGDIRGRVVDAQGKGITGAEVGYTSIEIITRNMRSMCSMNDSPSAITDKDGYFSFDELPVSSQFRFVAKAKGYASGESEFMRPDLDDITIILGPGHVIQGKVISADSRNPVAGMNLTCKSDISQGIKVIHKPSGETRYKVRGVGGSTETKSDDEGNFVFQDLDAGGYQITGSKTASDGGYVIQPQPPVMIAEDSATTEILLTAIASKTLRGKVIVQETKAPLTDARISCAGQNENRFIGGSATSGTDGTFAIDKLAVGDYEISIQKHGYLGLDSAGKLNASPPYNIARRNVKVTEGEDANIEIYFSTGGTVTGIVVDSTGQPVTGVHVTIPAGRGTFDPSGILVAQLTDSKGAFCLSGLPLDGQEFEVQAESDGYIRASGKVSLSEERKIVNLKLVLGSGGSVSGTLTDQKGNPIQDGVILSSPGAGYGTYSDASGRYVLKGLPAGKCEITARADGYLDKQVKDVQIAAGKESLVNIIMDPGWKITGTVVDLKGQGLSKVIVDPNVTTFTGGGFVTLDNGYFEIKDLPDGEVPLRFALEDEDNPSAAKRSWTFKTEGIRPSDQTQVFVLRLGGALHARLLDQAGNPISAAGLSAVLAATPQPQAAKGECALVKSACTIPLAKPELQVSDLPLGVYSLTIRSSAIDLKVIKDIEITADNAVDLGSITIQR